MAVKFLSQCLAYSKSPMSVKYFIITSVNVVVEMSHWDLSTLPPFLLFHLKVEKLPLIL